jgi:hypothetical protein
MRRPRGADAPRWRGRRHVDRRKRRRGRVCAAERESAIPLRQRAAPASAEPPFDARRAAGSRELPYSGRDHRAADGCDIGGRRGLSSTRPSPSGLPSVSRARLRCRRPCRGSRLDRRACAASPGVILCSAAADLVRARRRARSRAPPRVVRPRDAGCCGAPCRRAGCLPSSSVARAGSTERPDVARRRAHREHHDRRSRGRWPANGIPASTFVTSMHTV